MKYFSLLALLLAISLLSCSSKNSDDSDTMLITSGIWIKTLEYEDLDQNGSFVLFNDVCEQDDSWNFKTDGTLVLGPGAVLCDPDDDPALLTIECKWYLEDSDQTLVLEFPFDDIKYQIVSLSDNEMVLNVIEVGSPGVYKQRVVLQR